MNAARILEILDFRSANHTSLRHGVAQIVRGHELACLLGALPVQQDKYFARVVCIVIQVEPHLAGALAHTEMRVEGFLPLRIIRNLVADENMHHDALQEKQSLTQDTEIEAGMGTANCTAGCDVLAV